LSTTNSAWPSASAALSTTNRTWPSAMPLCPPRIPNGQCQCHFIHHCFLSGWVSEETTYHFYRQPVTGGRPCCTSRQQHHLLCIIIPSNLSTVKPTYNGMARERNFLRCRKVPFNTGALSVDHRAPDHPDCFR
jgi:hypothetical protein